MGVVLVVDVDSPLVDRLAKGFFLGKLVHIIS